MTDETVNLDELSDDDFLAAMKEAGQEPEIEIEAPIEDTDEQSGSDETEDDEVEANELIDDEVQDNTEPADETLEEEVQDNTQAENDSKDEADAESKDTEPETKNTEVKDGEDSEKADELNYKEEYAKILEEKNRLQGFYDEITGEFIANGRKTKGFTDPKKIIQSQQMAAGYTEKVAGFKPYKKFMSTLKSKGFLDDPDKFNLAMSLVDGDQEALKKHIKDLEIDPFEMDMENINYESKNAVASDIEIALDDVMDMASQRGVSEQVQGVISNDWDDNSVIELLEDPQNSSDLIDHISSGVYDLVQDRISDKRRVDVNGTFIGKSAIEQYREAAKELEAEYIRYNQEQQAVEPEPVIEQAAPEGNRWIAPEVELDPVVETQKAEYEAKVEKQIAKTNEARRRATSLSKKKRGTGRQKKFEDPLELDDEKFTEYMDSLIYRD